MSEVDNDLGEAKDFAEKAQDAFRRGEYNLAEKHFLKASQYGAAWPTLKEKVKEWDKAAARCRRLEALK